MDKFYLQAVTRKLKKKGASDKEVEDYIKNLTNPKMDEEEKEVEEVLSEVEASEETEELGEISGTDLPSDEEGV